MRLIKKIVSYLKEPSKNGYIDYWEQELRLENLSFLDPHLEDKLKEHGYNNDDIKDILYYQKELMGR